MSASFDQSLGYPNQNKLGDYYDMISDNAGVSVAWAATFNGEQDVYFLRIAVPEPSSWALLGIAALGIPLAMRRKRRRQTA